MQALSKTLSIDEQSYFKIQFALLEPNKNGTISLENIKEVCIISLVFHFSAIVYYFFSEITLFYPVQTLMKNGTEAMKESRIIDFLASVSYLKCSWPKNVFVAL